jgi:hypothetical protein
MFFIAAGVNVMTKPRNRTCTMAETILLVGKILVVFLILCKFISTFANITDRDEMLDVMGTALAMRAGDLPSNRSE